MSMVDIRAFAESRQTLRNTYCQRVELIHPCDPSLRPCECDVPDRKLMRHFKSLVLVQPVLGDKHHR